MRDRSIRDGPRTSRAEYAAEEDARMREEIIRLAKEYNVWQRLTSAERDDYVNEALREMRTPHPSLTAEERQR